MFQFPVHPLLYATPVTYRQFPEGAIYERKQELQRHVPGRVHAQQAFAAINNVRGWWSQAVEGDTDRLGAVFNYHYQDVHRATFQITEFVPAKKVTWHVLDNYFNFVKDKTEWTGTDIVFDIVPTGDKTEVHFTHVGLVPDYECYDVSSNAWSSYIAGSLRNLMTTGQGQPNPIEEVVDRAREMSGQDYATSFTVDQSPDEVFAAVNNVRGWWSEDIEGSTDQPGAEFTFRAGDIHRSTQRSRHGARQESRVAGRGQPDQLCRRQGGVDGDQHHL